VGLVSERAAVSSRGRLERRYSGRHYATGRQRYGVSGQYALVTFVLAATYPWMPGILRMLAFLAVSLSTIPAVLGALRRAHRADRYPWILLVVGLVSLNIDNLAWYWYVYGRHLPTADGTVSTLFGSVGMVFMLAGALAVVLKRGRNDIGGLIDATIVAMSAGGLLWDVLLLPHMEAVHAGLVAQISTCVNVFMLSGVLGALARLLLTARRFIPALWLLVSALALSLAGTVAVAMLAGAAAQARPAFTDMLFMGAYAALGLFGLARSAAGLLQPGPPAADDLSTSRLIFLGLALSAVPLAGGGRQVFGHDVDGVLLAIGAAAITPLVMIRIGLLSRQRALAEHALRYQATHDPLTGLPNRREFSNRLAVALHEKRRLVILLCDLDGFKAINDRLGHTAGDHLLIEISRRLRHCVRDGDLVCRYGGDEFLILCPDGTADEAALLCQRIAGELARPVELDGEAMVVGVSIGVVSDAGTATPEDLIHRADAAMYAAKQNRGHAPGVRAA
jgi:diguanylate cyclase (GGDEF)-like protein